MLAGTRNLQPIDNPIGTRLSTHVSGTICYPCLRSGQGPTRVVGRTRTMFHNTLVVDSSIRKPGKSSKTAKRPAVWIGVRPGELVGLEPCSITLWWLVRVRPAPPRIRAQLEIPPVFGFPSRHEG